MIIVLFGHDGALIGSFTDGRGPVEIDREACTVEFFSKTIDRRITIPLREMGCATLTILS